MKKLLLFFSIVISSLGVQGQNYLGINQSNYAGITRMDYNAASIVDSRYKMDVNLIGANVGIYNNFVSMKGSDIRTLFNGYVLDTTGVDSTFWDNSVRYNYDGQKKSFFLNTEIHLPSVMVSLNDKSAIAFTWKIRSYTNIDGVEEDLARLFINDFNYQDLWNVSLSNERISVQTMSWAEYGAGYGHVLHDEGEHFVKVGGRLKLLQGIQSAYGYVDNLNYEFVNQDSANIFSSDVRYGHSESFDPSTGQYDYRMDSKLGIGLDLGVVYEWRPDWQEYKYEMDGRDNLWRKDKNKYKMRVGFGVNDLGSIKFKKGYKSADFHADINNWNIRAILSDTSFSMQELDDTLFSLFEKLPSNEEYFRMNLPTAFNLEVDFHIWKDAYINLAGFGALQFNNDNNKVHHFTNLAITPRYDHKWLGIMLPISTSRYAGFRAGMALHLGPVFIGTSDMRALFSSGDIFGGDIFFATKIPIYHKHPKDKDGDKVSDEFDECIDVPGVWTFKGCPDTDGDLIQDSMDDCPAEAGLVEFNGCPDTDRDGIKDKDDECPMTAGLVEFNGCPDTDGDGIKDSDDFCPTVPGLKEFDGCPDTDGDGIQDTDDNCPTEAGPESNFGCPEKVRVHLVDQLGNIIASASMSENGGFVFTNLPLDQSYLFLLDGVDTDIEDELRLIIRNADGDHDIIAKLEDSGFFVYRYLEAEESTLELMEEEPLELIILEEAEKEVINKAFENLQFATGKAIIKAESYESLDELVELLKKHEEWNIKLEGHTDDVGAASANLMLSKKRAEAVKFYLNSRGISKERVITKFYGESKPIADNNTEEGRAKNRRVEMTIVNPDKE